MEMDIPLPEELEWLESNALHEEEQEDFEELIEEDFEEVQDPKSISPENSKKRRLHPDVVVVEGVSKSSPDEKKSRTAASSPEAVPDEEWLRYSPREDPVVVDDGGGDDDPVAGVVEEKLLSRFASEINGPSISVTGPCGDRVYSMMRHDEVYGGDRRGLNVRTSSKGLLSEPMNVLMEKVEQEALNKALQASFGASNDPMDEAVPISTEKLWVEKYAPSSFTELLSDEQTNREVLLWLKQWDNCVFGSQIRATNNDVLSALKRHSSVAQQKKFSDFRILSSKSNGFPLRNQNFKLSDALNEEKNNLKELWNKKTAANGSPEQKILLLCGPPGLGKTTLAHVAAKHCGYRVVEINASDDRSSSTIESKILDVVQMDSVMADSKPKCLVIDEIDGALGEGKGAVEVILKMVASDRKSAIKVGDAAEESQPGKASLKRSSRRATLLRPVICICNDLYAPALRPLRQVAKVHIFVKPAISRVVNRLKYICNKEGFKASGIGLSALAEYTEGDIRSCLNTLQFLNKKRESLKVWDIGSQVVGRKDMSRSVFDIWKEVFQKRRVKHEVKSMNSGVPGNMDFLYSLISDRGDYDLTMEGIYENFLHLSYHDPLMQKTGKCLDFLGGSDTLLQYIMRTQQMFLYVYQPFIAISIHSEIAQVGKPNIEWPKATQRSRAMLMEKKEILKCWHNKISPQISRHLSIASFVTDVVSLLLHVLSPSTLRPVALHLLSQREREDLAQLVDTMVSYSLTYKNMKYEPLLTNQREAVSDASMLSLEPPIEHFISFKDYQTGHCVLSSAIKQVLVHEIEKRKILRENGGHQPVHPSAESNSDQPLCTKDIGAFSNQTNNINSSIKMNRENPNCALTHESLKAGASPNSILRDNKCGTANGVKVKAPIIANRRSSSSSFFDRFRKLSSKGSEIPDDYQQKPATMERDSRPFLFKYNEGFTNAVKRPVRIRELLP